MGLVAVLVLVLTLVPAVGLLAGGLHLVRQPSRAYGLGVGMLVLACLLGLFGVVAVVAIVDSVT